MAIPADEVAEAMGVGRKGMRWWRLLALAQVPLTLTAVGGWAWEKYAEPQIIPRIVWVDNDNMRVLAEASVDEPDREAIYAAVGRLWVWNIRSRADHPVMNAAFEREGQKLSDQKAWKQIAAMLEQVKKEHGCTEKECQSGVEVVGVITSQVDDGVRKDQAGNEFAMVDVSWHERKFGKDAGSGPVFGFTAKLHIMAKAPPRTGEIPPNPFGLYVIGYRFERTGPANQLAETVQ